LFDQGSLGSLSRVGGGSYVFEDKEEQEGSSLHTEQLVNYVVK